MGKLLLLLAIGVILYLLLKGVGKSAAQRRRATRDSELMVHCSQCGVHLPQSEAAAQGELYFCSEEHRRLFKP